MIRQAAVAGQFYSSNPHQLRAELRDFVAFREPRKTVLGIMAPHAGYIYSGAVAGAAYGTIKVPDTVIILGPNHHGFGARVALYPEGEWLTPLGAVKINTGLASLLKAQSRLVEEDVVAHHYEHSLEVQVPFLQFINPRVSIVPLCLGISDFLSCRTLGEEIARAIIDFAGEVLIVASSDMTHYESATAAKNKDDLALHELLNLNPEGLLAICRKKGITMCGVVPATVMLIAALELGAKEAKLVRYATSGDVTGDTDQVVAYASVTVA